MHRGRILIHTAPKIAGLLRFTYDKNKHKPEDIMNEHDIGRFRSVKGTLLYIGGIRPDITYDLYALSKGNVNEFT